MIKAILGTAALPAFLFATAAAAQDDSSPREPRRFRVALGPQITPRYPGSEDLRLVPFWDISTSRGDKPFKFESADESVGVPLFDTGSFAIGPAFNLEGSRRRDETDLPVDEVGVSIEAGAFADFWLGSAIRARGEVRKGVTGHKAITGAVSLDYVARDGDKWLFALGPRVSLSDAKYQRAYFGVSPAASARTGLATFDPDGGIHAVGASASALYAFDRSWGVYGFAKYDRLVADAARSPIVRAIGSRNQFSGGLALTYTFGGGR